MRFKDLVGLRPLFEMAMKYEKSKFYKIYDALLEKDYNFAGLTRPGVQKILFYFALIHNKGNIGAAAKSVEYSKKAFSDFVDKFFTQEQIDDVGPGGALYGSSTSVNEMAKRAAAIPEDVDKIVSYWISKFKADGIDKLLNDAGFEDLWWAIIRAQQMRILKEKLEKTGSVIGWQNQLKKDLYKDPTVNYDDPKVKLYGSTTREDLKKMYKWTDEADIEGETPDNISIKGWGASGLLRAARKDPKAMEALKKQYVVSRLKGELEDDAESKKVDAELDVKQKLAAAKAKLDAIKASGDEPDDDFWDSI